MPLKKADLARDVWRHLFDFIIRTRAHRDRALEQYGLTPNDSRALFSLDDREGRTMRALADEWTCDPSNATWIVDRLERLGYAERQADPSDRRVKRVVLTRTGAKTKAALSQQLYEPPEELLALERTDLERLLEAAAKLDR
jgi:DNA-binding MarR family transcriptional regulator